MSEHNENSPPNGPPSTFWANLSAFLKATFTGTFESKTFEQKCLYISLISVSVVALLFAGLMGVLFVRKRLLKAELNKTPYAPPPLSMGSDDDLAKDSSPPV
jgi:hypothetical protein